MFAPGIDEEPVLTRKIAQHGIDAVDPILHRRVSARHLKSSMVAVGVPAEEISNDLPVSARGRAFGLSTRRIAIDIYDQRRRLKPTLQLVKIFLSLLAGVCGCNGQLRTAGPFEGPREEFIAGLQGIRIGQD